MLKAAQHLGIPVGVSPDPAHEVRAGQIKLILADRLADMLEQIICLVAECLSDPVNGIRRSSWRRSNHHDDIPPLLSNFLKTTRVPRMVNSLA
jgi:hypothetical protein